MTGHHVFESPERFSVGAVGEPGRRAFYLQAGDRGRDVTVAVEKEEVAALADALTRLLAEIGTFGGPSVIEPDASLDESRLAPDADGGVDADFALDRLTLAWDGETVIVEAAAPGHVVVPELEMTEAVSDEQAADEAAILAELDAELEELEVPLLVDDLEQPVASLRVRLTLAQAAAFVERAERVVAAGRPSCPLCERPMAATGHACPRLN